MAAAGLAVLSMSACTDYVGKVPKHLAPLERGTKRLIESKGMEERAPILIRVFKEESTLEIWKKQTATGKYALLKDYEICKWSGVLGPKLKEGDRQAPEGFYTIRPAQMNPNSSYHLSFNIGFPNDFDRAHGRTGTHLMVHGACSSAGCYSMTDEQIQEIYTLGRLAFEGGQRDFQVQAFPFRMTAENMARHRGNPNMPFWRMLKEGYDHFELLRQPPKVDVCDRRYVFNAVPGEGQVFNAAAACPPMQMPDEIRVAIAEKDREDNRRIQELAAKLDRKEGTAGSKLLAEVLAMPTTVALAGPMSAPAGSLSLEPTAVAEAAPATAPASDAAQPSPTAGAPAVAVAAPPATGTAAVNPTSTAASAPTVLSVGAAPAVAPAATAAVTTPAPAEEALRATAAMAPAGVAEPAAAAPAETAAIRVPSAPSGAETAAAAPSSGASEPAQPDAVSIEERMQAESAPAESGMANAYAAPAEAESGLAGFVLELFE